MSDQPNNVVPEAAADDVEFVGAAEAADIEVVECPAETGGWQVYRAESIEYFETPAGLVYVRARLNEEPDLIVRFTRITPMPPLRLVLASGSINVRRAERKARREKRELRARGYDV